MRIVDLEFKAHDFVHDEVSWSVHSHKSFQAHNATFIVKLLGPGCEIAVEALTRGEGMVMLADIMKSLGFKHRDTYKTPCRATTASYKDGVRADIRNRLAREALEQEGAFHRLTSKERT